MDYETTQFIKQQFAALTAKIDDVSTKVEFMDQKLESIRQRLDKTASADELHRVFDSLDHIAKQYDDHGQDHDLADGQLERHDRWLHEIADKLGMKLSDA